MSASKPILIVGNKASDSLPLLSALLSQAKVVEWHPPAQLPENTAVIAPSVQSPEALESAAWGKYTITCADTNDYSPPAKSCRNNAKQFGMSIGRRKGGRK